MPAARAISQPCSTSSDSATIPHDLGGQLDTAGLGHPLPGGIIVPRIREVVHVTLHIVPPLRRQLGLLVLRRVWRRRRQRAELFACRSRERLRQAVNMGQQGGEVQVATRGSDGPVPYRRSWQSWRPRDRQLPISIAPWGCRWTCAPSRRLRVLTGTDRPTADFSSAGDVVRPRRSRPSGRTRDVDVVLQACTQMRHRSHPGFTGTCRLRKSSWSETLRSKSSPT